MLSKQEIVTYLRRLNDELKNEDVKGEVCLYGGAVMYLVFDARPSTKDVDAIFKPAQIMRNAIKNVAHFNNLNPDWLNDGVKGFVVKHAYEILYQWSHLKVYVPEPDYLLAMKALSGRIDGTDKGDIQFLIKKLKIKDADTVLKILENYYPRQQIKPATQFFVEELFQ